MAIRTTIFALLALAVTGCPASRQDVHAAQTSGYKADFAIVYSNVLAAVTDLYPHLAENPAAGVIRTAWHQIRIRQSDDGTTTGTTVGPAMAYDPTDPNATMQPTGGGLPTGQGIHPGGTIYFVRFNVFVLGGKPWRVRVEAEAAEWEAGMKQARLKGAERPAWLKGRTEALQVAIYKRLRKYAVPLRTKTERKASPAAAAVDLSVYGDIPRLAAERAHALREALLAGKFDAVRAFLVDDFVWSAGGAPSADQAVIMWQADPTLASRLIGILHAGCALGDGEVITCPAAPAAGALRATFVKRGDLWMLASFLAE